MPENKVGAYHPQIAPMEILLLSGGTGGNLVCHYYPEEATETLSAEFESIPAGGAFMKTLQFMWGEPRKISMKLLFNEWGENPARKAPGAKSVAASLDWLRSVIHPWNGRNLNTHIWKGKKNPSGIAHNSPPPLLGVALTDEMFEGHLTSMTILFVKLNAQKVPIRAEVDVEFTQYVPTDAGGGKP